MMKETSPAQMRSQRGIRVLTAAATLPKCHSLVGNDTFSGLVSGGDTFTIHCRRELAICSKEVYSTFSCLQKLEGVIAKVSKLVVVSTKNQIPDLRQH
jgi:hypothetical protein